MILWTCGACHRWTPIEHYAGRDDRDGSVMPDKLRVVTLDGRETELLKGSRFTADSLVGTDAQSDSRAPESAGANRVAFELQDIERIEARRSSPGATVGLIGGGVALLGASLYGVAYGIGQTLR